MPLAPLSTFASVLGGQTAQDFSARHATEDVVLIEPYEKGRTYGGPLHPDTSYMFLPRAPGSPVPVGRDERAIVQIDHAAVSRLHLVLAWSGRTWQAMDRSSNGSWQEGQRMPREQAIDLPYGVTVRLGRAVVLRVQTPGELYELITRAPDTRTWARDLGSSQPPQADAGSSTWRFPREANPPSAMPTATYEVPKPPSDEIEIEFDLDFDDGGQGGFA